MEDCPPWFLLCLGFPRALSWDHACFLVHLMDISVNLSAGTTSTYFADDTRLKHGIESEQDSESLQQDLETMYTWTEEVGMEFNAGRFELLRFWPDRNDAPLYGSRWQPH